MTMNAVVRHPKLGMSDAEEVVRRLKENLRSCVTKDASDRRGRRSEKVQD